MFSFHVKSVSHREKPTENYPPTQLFPSALWSVYGSLNSLLRFNDLQLHCCGLLSPLLYDLASRCGSQPTKPLYASCPITTTSQLVQSCVVLTRWLRKTFSTAVRSRGRHTCLHRMARPHLSKNNTG